MRTGEKHDQTANVKIYEGGTIFSGTSVRDRPAGKGGEFEYSNQKIRRECAMRCSSRPGYGKNKTGRKIGGISDKNPWH